MIELALTFRYLMIARIGPLSPFSRRRFDGPSSVAGDIDRIPASHSVQPQNGVDCSTDRTRNIQQKMSQHKVFTRDQLVRSVKGSVFTKSVNLLLLLAPEEHDV
jgi:hypothetical protein